MKPENETTTTEQLSFEDFKKSLGSASSKYSDQEIERIRVTFDGIANVFFDDWLQKRNSA
jgi:hypothetical protein